MTVRMQTSTRLARWPWADPGIPVDCSILACRTKNLDAKQLLSTQEILVWRGGKTWREGPGRARLSTAFIRFYGHTFIIPCFIYLLMKYLSKIRMICRDNSNHQASLNSTQYPCSTKSKGVMSTVLLLSKWPGGNGFMTPSPGHWEKPADEHPRDAGMGKVLCRQ